MPDEIVEETVALLAAATPGPWSWTGNELRAESDGSTTVVGEPMVGGWGEPEWDISEADAALVAAAPALLRRWLDRDRDREAVVKAAPDDGEMGQIAALLTSQSLPMDMQPMRARLVRKVRRLRSVLATLRAGGSSRG
jgi:hypothetical protein